jgi:hypothetical protein
MKSKTIILIACLILFSQEMLSQPVLPGDSNSGGNVTDTPINFLLIPFLVLAAYIGIKNIKSTNK